MATPKNVKVEFNPQRKSFYYSGDIDSREVILVRGKGRIPINFHLRGADWADDPICWVDEGKRPHNCPSCMRVSRRNDRLVQIDDDCTTESAGTYRFVLRVVVDGEVIESDPSIANEPISGY
ncbi:MAG: hypothetical protein AAGD01_19150 [Acidobacteriota bacterium]